MLHSSITTRFRHKRISLAKKIFPSFKWALTSFSIWTMTISRAAICSRKPCAQVKGPQEGQQLKVTRSFSSSITQFCMESQSPALLQLDLTLLHSLLSFHWQLGGFCCTHTSAGVVHIC
eukprot:1152788-Pelagomonas_calceolata.AAC.3